VNAASAASDGRPDATALSYRRDIAMTTGQSVSQRRIVQDDLRPDCIAARRLLACSLILLPFNVLIAANPASMK